MKKYLSLLSVLVIALVVILPITAKATVKTNFSCSEHKKDDQGRTYETCTLSVTTTAGESISSYEGELTLTNVTLDESTLTGSGAFSAVALGNTLSFTASTPQTGETIAIGSFNVIVDDTKSECHVVLTPTSADVDKSPVTVDVTPVENPKTGSAVSYIAIGAGLLLIAGAYVVSRKNTKMYKI